MSTNKNKQNTKKRRNSDIDNTNSENKGRKNTSNKKQSKNKSLLSLFFISLLLFAAGIALPLVLKADLINKYYTNGIFKLVRVALGAVSSLLGFSITEVAAVLLATAILVILIIFIIKIFAKTIRLKSVISFIVIILFIASLILNVYNLTFGLNYRSTTLAQKLDLDVKDYSVIELNALCVSLREEANELRKYVSEDSNGVFTIDDVNSVLYRVSQDTKASSINTDKRRIYKPKPAGCSQVMSYMGITGIYMPFFAEATINQDQPDLLIASTAAHECAHSIGIAREDEANLASYIICTESDDYSIKYSGTINALMYCSSQLFYKDNYLYYELLKGYDQSVRKDINNHLEYWDEYDTFVKDVVSNTNDSYLKYNGSKNGKNSYYDVVGLLIAYRQKNGI